MLRGLFPRHCAHRDGRGTVKESGSLKKMLYVKELFRDNHFAEHDRDEAEKANVSSFSYKTKEGGCLKAKMSPLEIEQGLPAFIRH